MKKLLIKDKKARKEFKNNELKYFVLKYIFKNLNLYTLIRWKAFLKLKDFKKNNKNSFTNRCLYSINKKRFNKLTNFSRHVFLKLIRTGQIHGIKKAS